MTAHLKEIMELSVPERILLVEAIWDSIASETITIGLSPSHKKILNARLKKYNENPSGGSSWDEVKNRIRNKK